VKPEQLPKKEEMKTYLKADLIRDKTTGNVTSVKLRGKRFEKTSKPAIYGDGKKVDLGNNEAFFDEKGNLDMTFNYLFTPGGHTILMEQETPNGIVKEATTIMIPLSDNPRKEVTVNPW
jgi:hypothetical protein